MMDTKNDIFVLFIVILTLLASVLLSSSHSGYAQNNNNTNITTSNANPIGQLTIHFFQLRDNISGNYSNPPFGIEDIVFPPEWHGRAIETGSGLFVNLHPLNQSQYLSNLLNKQNPIITPVILLQALNNSQINRLKLPEFSISKSCKELASNSTSAIDGKTFHVYTIECPFSKIFSGVANKNSNADIYGPSVNNSAIPTDFNINGLVQSKVYEYKTVDRTYRLMLIVASPPLFPSTSAAPQEKPDISKYTSIIDATATTLRLR